MKSLPVLVLNSGSSSIKFAVYEAGGDERTRLFEGAVDGIGANSGKSGLGEFWIKDASGKKLVEEKPALPSRVEAFALIEKALKSGAISGLAIPAPAAIGHRMVCGGPTVTENQRITPALIDEMEKYTAFAPLHTPIAIYIMREAMRLFPGVPNFVCLDSWFHRTMADVAERLPIPEEYAAMGVRRFGAHGLSYESIVYQLQPRVPERLIAAHLGNGASISAIWRGACIDTSMGLTPTGGLISGTRTGDIDPGVLLFILRTIGKSKANTADAADELEAVAAKRAGLEGVSGLSNDMRMLRDAIKAGNKRARLAVDQFTWTVKKWIGAFVAELGGMDMLVFTGGIGENDIAGRAEICAGLDSLGIVLDAERNKVQGAAEISAEGSPAMVRVIPPLEDLMILNHVLRLMAASSAQ